MPPDAEALPSRSRVLPARPVLAGVALAALVGVGLAVNRLWPGEVSALVRQAAAAERSLGVAGWLIAACVQVLIALCGILPASIGAFAVGMAYGVAGGFLLAGTATIAGAMLAFLLARGLFRPLAERALSRYPKMQRLDDAVVRDGWRIVALMRLSPVMPFALTSYALGLTSLPLCPYVIGTVASLPALLGYVAMGHFARLGALLSGGPVSPLRWAILAFSVCATALLIFRLAGIARLVFRLPGPPRAEANQGVKAAVLR